jgi:hypothetical protein
MLRPPPPVMLPALPAARISSRAWCGFAAGLGLMLALAACTTAQVDQIPHNVGGLPEGAPARPAVQPDYPAVHDMPPPRAQPLLDEEAQKRLERDLTNTRNRQSTQPAKQPAKQPAAKTGQSRDP